MKRHRKDAGGTGRQSGADAGHGMHQAEGARPAQQRRSGIQEQQVRTGDRSLPAGSEARSHARSTRGSIWRPHMPSRYVRRRRHSGQHPHGANRPSISTRQVLAGRSQEHQQRQGHRLPVPADEEIRRWRRSIYKKASELDPNDPEPYYSIAVIDWTQTYQPRMEERAEAGPEAGRFAAGKDKKVCAKMPGKE